MSDTGFTVPTRAQLIDQSASDIESRLGGTDARLRRSLVTIFATVLGGMLDGLYSFAKWMALQLFAATMEAEYLDARASLWGMTREGPTAAEGTATAAANNGIDVPTGTVLVRADGALFTTAADVVSAGNSVTLTLEANTPGSAGNTLAGTQLQFQVTIAGISNVATVSGGVGTYGIAGGTDEESYAALRARIATRQASPPQGGCANDYVEWALAQPGVTRAWCLPQWMGPGTVGVTFVMDGRPDIIPLAGDVTAVQTALDVLRPVRATLYVIAPNTDVVNITYHLVPSNPATQAAAAAALADLFAREQTAGGGTIYLSHLDNAVKNAAGVVDMTRSAPVANIVTAAGTIAMLGAVTWD